MNEKQRNCDIIKNVPLIASITEWSLLPKIFLLEKIKYVNDDDDDDGDDDDDDDDDANSHSQSFYKTASLKNFEDFTKKTCDGILVLLKIGSITGVSLQLLRSFSK